MKRFFIALVGIVGLAVNVMPASALSGSQFDAGRIIDDSIFYNNNSMSVQQIQQFLNSKIGTCDHTGSRTSELGGGTRAQYGAAHGTPAPFVCINEYFENPDTRENNLSGRPIPSGGISAAQIIWNESQTYHVNPQVLITIIQREQGLITDTWPLVSQYNAAAGYGCPDNGPNHSIVCQERYFGFYNQVANAAWQIRQYTDNPNNFNYVPYRNNTILWNPQPSCGTSTVYIQTRGTASLYNYAPYRPNQAALNNLYGLGDGCSAYANRNFWRYFNDWFGATTGIRFNSEYVSWSSYPTLKAGESTDAWFFFRNTGTSPWNDLSAYDGGLPPITLAATNPINRFSAFSQGWVNPSRPAVNFSEVYEADGRTLTANQHRAEPGQIAVFRFHFTVPVGTAPGVYREFFQPVAEGAPDWQMGSVGFLDVTVAPADYQASIYRILGNPVPRTDRGGSTPVAADYKNTGAKPWYDDISVPGGEKPVHLANTSPINRTSPLTGFDWPSANRPSRIFAAVYEADGRTLAGNQHIAYPGQIARFHYYYTAPLTLPAGVYREYIQPIHEGASDWNMGAVGSVDVTVNGPDYALRYYRLSGYPTITRGSSTTVSIDYQNMGNQTLYDSSTGGPNPLDLANIMPINRESSPFFDPTWTSRSRPQTLFSAVYEADGVTLAADQHRASTGQIIRYTYKYAAPSNLAPGAYQEWIQPVREMAPNWDIGGGGFFQITVQ